MKRYLWSFLLFLLLLLTVGFSSSWLIDPYALYQQADSALFKRKTAAADKGRTIKSYQVRQRDVVSLIVGNSRVELGMPQNHPFYGGPVFNMGLPGASVLMQYDYAWHAVNTNPTLKQVLLAVDFVDFLGSKAIEQSWDGNWQYRLDYRLGDGTTLLPLNRQRSFEKLSLLFSQDALVDGVMTALQQKRDVNALNYSGFNDGALYRHAVRTESYAALYQQKQQELRARLAKPALVMVDNSAALQALQRFVSLLREQQIAVVLFINPYQQPYLDAIQQAGLADEMLRWKQQIIDIAKSHTIDLYDFAVPSLPVTLPAPLQSRQPDDNRYFWEPAHYKTQLGELMLNAMQQQQCQQPIDGVSVELCQRFSSVLGQIKSN